MIHTISAQDSVAFEEALGTRNQAQPLSATAATPRLLLVDDEPMMLHSLLALLEDEGYQLTTASSGAEAFALLEQRQFDLALLDLRLPDCSGHDIMDYINAEALDTKILLRQIGVISKRSAADVMKDLGF